MSILSVLLLSSFLFSISAYSAPSLGQASDFAILAATTVTSTGAIGTVITGDLGLYPGSDVVGFGPGILNGQKFIADPIALLAQGNVTAAYNQLAGEPCNVTGHGLTGTDLGGLTLTPGVYCFTSAASCTGARTLDGLGDPKAVFIFQVQSSLLFTLHSTVGLVNGSSAAAVFWQVGSSATLEAGTVITGTIIAYTSISIKTGATLITTTINVPQ
jgi:hypothetical protein